MKAKIVLLNLISTILLQIITIISGFVVPRLIIDAFGSEMNGLISSCTQFLNYISLLEGGVNSVIMASLFRPLVNKDMKKISSIIKTSDAFFKKIALILVIYAASVAALCPYIIKSNYGWSFIAGLVIILSIKLFAQYCFSLSIRNLLNADGRVYIVSFVQAALAVIDIIAAILVLRVYPDVHVLKIVSALIYVAQPIILRIYVKKHYDIDSNVEKDKKLLKDRWNGFAINLAYFIHSNTDIAIISIVNGLKDASVYSVYAMVITGIKTISQSLWKAIGPSMGKIYASGNNNRLIERLNVCEYITFFMTFFLFSLTGLLITPFVMIYTSGITDTNYYQPLFGVILVLAEGLYILREPYVSLAYNANKFKDIRIHAIIEALMNIVISLALTPIMGLVGIAIGTFIAMLYRTIFQIIYVHKSLIKRPITAFMKHILPFIFTTIIMVYICIKLLPIEKTDLSLWIKSAISYGLLFLGGYSIMSILFFRDDIKALLNYIKRKE